MQCCELHLRVVVLCCTHKGEGVDSLVKDVHHVQPRGIIAWTTQLPNHLFCDVLRVHIVAYKL